LQAARELLSLKWQKSTDTEIVEREADVDSIVCPQSFEILDNKIRKLKLN